MTQFQVKAREGPLGSNPLSRGWPEAWGVGSDGRGERDVLPGGVQAVGVMNCMGTSKGGRRI